MASNTAHAAYIGCLDFTFSEPPLCVRASVTVSLCSSGWPRTHSHSPCPTLPSWDYTTPGSLPIFDWLTCFVHVDFLWFWKLMFYLWVSVKDLLPLTRLSLCWLFHQIWRSCLIAVIRFVSSHFCFPCFWSPSQKNCCCANILMSFPSIFSTVILDPGVSY